MKNRLDYKLLNTALLVLIIYFMYHTGNLWIGIFNKVIQIIFPFFLSFVIAYALYPFMKSLMNKGLSKGVSVFIILLCLFGLIGVILALVFPLLVEQLKMLSELVIVFIGEVGNKYQFDFGSLQSVLNNGFKEIIASVSQYVSNGALKVINVSLSYLANAFIVFSAAIYFLLEMPNIREEIKKSLSKKSKRVYRYVSILDHEMKNYLTGMLEVMFITFFEYALAYKIIGHPNALLLGFLAAIAGFIPYFGGIFVNIVAAVTSFVVSPALFIRTCITFALLSGIDGYVINPLVYGKTNNVHPLIVIFSVFAGGILFGIFGIMISFPAAVIIISTYKYFKEDITDKIQDRKVKKTYNKSLGRK